MFLNWLRSTTGTPIVWIVLGWVSYELWAAKGWPMWAWILFVVGVGTADAVLEAMLR